MSGVLKLQSSVQVVDEMEAPNVDPPDTERVNLAVDDRNQVDRVKTKRDDQGRVAEA